MVSGLWAAVAFAEFSGLTGSSEQDPHSSAPGGPRRRLGPAKLCNSRAGCVVSSQELSPSPLLPCRMPMSWEALMFPGLNPAVKSHAQEMAERVKSLWYHGGFETGSCTRCCMLLALLLRGVMLSFV